MSDGAEIEALLLARETTPPTDDPPGATDAVRRGRDRAPRKSTVEGDDSILRWKAEDFELGTNVSLHARLQRLCAKRLLIFWQTRGTRHGEKRDNYRIGDLREHWKSMESEAERALGKQSTHDNLLGSGPWSSVGKILSDIPNDKYGFLQAARYLAPDLCPRSCEIGQLECRQLDAAAAFLAEQDFKQAIEENNTKLVQLISPKWLPQIGVGLTVADLTAPGSMDAESADAGSTAADSIEVDLPTAGSTEAGLTEADPTEAGSTEAGSTEAGSTEAGSTEAGLVVGGWWLVLSDLAADSVEADSTEAGSTRRSRAQKAARESPWELGKIFRMPSRTRTARRWPDWRALQCALETKREAAEAERRAEAESRTEKQAQKNAEKQRALETKREAMEAERRAEAESRAENQAQKNAEKQAQMRLSEWE